MNPPLGERESYLWQSGALLDALQDERQADAVVVARKFLHALLTDGANDPGTLALFRRQVFQIETVLVPVASLHDIVDAADAQQLHGLCQGVFRLGDTIVACHDRKEGVR